METTVGVTVGVTVVGVTVVGVTVVGVTVVGVTVVGVTVVGVTVVGVTVGVVPKNPCTYFVYGSLGLSAIYLLTAPWNVAAKSAGLIAPDFNAFTKLS